MCYDCVVPKAKFRHVYRQVVGSDQRMRHGFACYLKLEQFAIVQNNQTLPSRFGYTVSGLYLFGIDSNRS